jgi:hypothetical protein
MGTMAESSDPSRTGQVILRNGLSSAFTPAIVLTDAHTSLGDAASLEEIEKE